MDTIEGEVKGERRRRRRHSAQFKADLVAASSRPGVSIASVALANGVNANLLRRWVVEHEGKAGTLVDPASLPQRSHPAFLPMRLDTPGVPEPDIRIELRRGATAVNVTWPARASAQCAAWLRELLK